MYIFLFESIIKAKDLQSSLLISDLPGLASSIAMVERIFSVDSRKGFANSVFIISSQVLYSGNKRIKIIEHVIYILKSTEFSFNMLILKKTS